MVTSVLVALKDKDKLDKKGENGRLYVSRFISKGCAMQSVST